MGIMSSQDHPAVYKPVIDKAVDFVVQQLDRVLTIIFVLAFDGCRLDHHVERMTEAETQLAIEIKRVEEDAKDYRARNPKMKISGVLQSNLELAKNLIGESGTIAKDFQKTEGACLPCFWSFPNHIIPSYKQSRSARNLAEKMSRQKDVLKSEFSPDGDGGKYRMYGGDIENESKELPPPSSSGLSHPGDEGIEFSGRSGKLKAAARSAVIPVKAAPSLLNTMLDKIIDLVNEDSKIWYVGIHGMAGVGKTHLLRSLLNKIDLEKHTFKVLMVTVGEKLDITKIREAMAGQLHVFVRPDRAAKDLFDALKKNDNYLILFDDVWEKLPLEDIGIPDPKENPHGCKVVVATRLQTVCGYAQISIPVECLSSEVSWKLLVENVDDATTVLITSEKNVRDAAREIVAKCQGLPLAIIAVAQAMRGKPGKAWKDAARNINEQPWKVPGMAYRVLRELKRSYDNLPSDGLRSSFMYFCMYPEVKTMPLKVEWCADYWIGEGTVTDYDDMTGAVSKTRGIVKELQNAGLLDNDCWPHPIVRAMAFWVGSEEGSKENKWVVKPASGLVEAPPAEDWSDAERVSLSKNPITRWPEQPDCPHLMSLLLWDSVHLSRFSDSFFGSMSSLLVLELTLSHLEELPPSIGQLYSLRYLDLAECPNLSSLPEELRNLGELRLLNLQWTAKLKTIPRGVFEGLKKLEVLRMKGSYSSWEVDDGTTHTGAHAQELASLTHLKQMDVVVDTMSALEIIAASPVMQSALRDLSLSCFRGTKTIQIPRDLGLNTRILEQLTVFKCMDLEELVIQGSDTGGANMVSNLQVLYLKELPALRTISNQSVEFPCLRQLWVHKCPNVKLLPLGTHCAKNLKKIWGSRQWWEGLQWDKEVVKSTFEQFFEECN